VRISELYKTVASGGPFVEEGRSFYKRARKEVKKGLEEPWEATIAFPPKNWAPEKGNMPSLRKVPDGDRGKDITFLKSDCRIPERSLRGVLQKREEYLQPPEGLPSSLKGLRSVQDGLSPEVLLRRGLLHSLYSNLSMVRRKGEKAGKIMKKGLYQSWKTKRARQRGRYNAGGGLLVRKKAVLT